LNDLFANAWEKSLRHKLKKLPNFEGAFKKVREIINEIKM